MKINENKENTGNHTLRKTLLRAGNYTFRVLEKKKSARLITILAIAVFIAVAASTRAFLGGENKSSPAVSTQTSHPSPDNNQSYIHPGMLSSRLRAPLHTLGSRLHKPGNERLMITGSLLQSGDAQASPFALIWEMPGRIRLTKTRGGNQRVLVFDGQDLKANSQIDKSDRDIMELLVFDSVEHFFIAQSNGSAALRFLGGNFREEGDPAATPYYLFQASEEVGFPGHTRQQTRTYYFNSSTHLLERVRYHDDSNGPVKKVEVRFSDWLNQGDQQVARRIERLENGAPVLTLVLQGVAVGPRGDQGVFAPPQ
jgi:hypothetical protein